MRKVSDSLSSARVTMLYDSNRLSAVSRLRDNVSQNVPRQISSCSIHTSLCRKSSVLKAGLGDVFEAYLILNASGIVVAA